MAWRRHRRHRPRRPGRRSMHRARLGAGRHRPAAAARPQRRARHRAPRVDRRLRRHTAHARRPVAVLRPLSTRLRPALVVLRQAAGRAPAAVPGGGSRRRQRRARRDGRVGRLLQPGHGIHQHGRVHRRRHRHRLFGADEQGRRQRQPPREVPAQRAGGRQEEVADRRVPGVLRRPGRPARRPGDRRHHRDGRRDGRRGRGVPADAGLLLRGPAAAGPHRRRPRAHRGTAAARHPGRPRRGRLPVADLHQAHRRSAHGLLRADRAARLARLRQGQLQGTLRGDRARTGPARQLLTATMATLAAGEGPVAHYRQVGDVPPKRHTQFRRPDGGLYSEELMGEEGFSSDSSLLYHRGIPSAMVDARPWELPDQSLTPNAPLVPRHLKLHDLFPGEEHKATDPVTGRRLVRGNAAVRISYAVSSLTSPYYRNAVGDECVYVERGTATVETTFGVLEVGPGDYVILPRATTPRWTPTGDEPLRTYAIEANSHIGPPKRYLSKYGQFLEHAPYCERDLRAPAEPLLADGTDSHGDTEVYVKHRGAGPGG